MELYPQSATAHLTFAGSSSPRDMSTEAQPKDMPAKVWQYNLGANPEARVVTDSPDEAELKKKLESFLQTATKSLLDNTAGVEDPK